MIKTRKEVRERRKRIKQLLEDGISVSEIARRLRLSLGSVHQHIEAIKNGNGEQITCKCPKCGRRYSRELVWIGCGTPRVYCDSCLIDISGKDWHESYHVAIEGFG